MLLGGGGESYEPKNALDGDANTEFSSKYLPFYTEPFFYLKSIQDGIVYIHMSFLWAVRDLGPGEFVKFQAELVSHTNGTESCQGLLVSSVRISLKNEKEVTKVKSMLQQKRKTLFCRENVY